MLPAVGSRAGPPGCSLLSRSSLSPQSSLPAARFSAGQTLGQSRPPSRLTCFAVWRTRRPPERGSRQRTRGCDWKRQPSGQGDNSRANSPRAGAPGLVPDHPVGQGRVGPPAWWCCRMGSESLQSCCARSLGCLAESMQNFDGV